MLSRDSFFWKQRLAWLQVQGQKLQQRESLVVWQEGQTQGRAQLGGKKEKRGEVNTSQHQSWQSAILVSLTYLAEIQVISFDR